jgi:hypothetical protein
MTFTIHVPLEQEAAVRDAHARGDRTRLLHLLRDLADQAILEEDPLDRALSEVRAELPREKLRRVAAARTLLRPGRPFPEGKNLDDLVFGKWPGGETDEEVRVALDRLS